MTALNNKKKTVYLTNILKFGDASLKMNFEENNHNLQFILKEDSVVVYAN